jgi:hypothetical protein
MRTSDWDDPENRAIGRRTLPRPTISPLSFTTSAHTQPSFSGLNPIRGGHGTSQSR